ncbi:hypothetical protein PM082_018392 [Marasmius tenuissimus]|nr:hypothetical protein PM082_018392 [Marasmius tenuissimus]
MRTAETGCRKSTRRTRSTAGNSTKTRAKAGVSRLCTEISEDDVENGGSMDVKREGSPVIWFRPTPVPSTHIEHSGWDHPAELEYCTPPDWTDTDIIHHLIAHSFDIPPKKSKKPSFFEVIGIGGSRTVLPNGYRIPLMFIARFQWLSLKLVLSADNREAEWKQYKHGILHASRLCQELLKFAQEVLGGFDAESEVKCKLKGIDKMWRSQMFDRVLTRFKLKWFLFQPEQLQAFWENHGDEEYQKDTLKFDWRRWALKGHKGFSLTKDEIENGISAQQHMSGLKMENGKWYWDERHPSTASGVDAWNLRQVAQLSGKTMMASPLHSRAPSTPPCVTFTAPKGLSKAAPVPKQSITGTEPSVPSASTSCGLGKRPGTLLEKVDGTKNRKTVAGGASKKATAAPISVGDTGPDPAPSAFSAPPSKVRPLKPPPTDVGHMGQQPDRRESFSRTTSRLPQPDSPRRGASGRKRKERRISGTSGLTTSPTVDPTPNLPMPPCPVPVPYQRLTSGPASNPPVTPLPWNARKRVAPTMHASSQPGSHARQHFWKPDTASAQISGTNVNSQVASAVGLFPNTGGTGGHIASLAPTPTPTPFPGPVPNAAVLARPSSSSLLPTHSSAVLAANQNRLQEMFNAMQSMFREIGGSFERCSAALENARMAGARDYQESFDDAVRSVLETSGEEILLSPSGHPLAHLIVEADAGMPVDGAGNKTFLYEPALTEKTIRSYTNVADAQPLNRDRSTSGASMLISTDIQFTRSEAAEKKFRPTPPFTEPEVQSHLSPRLTSPFNIHDMEDLKPVLTDGRAFLHNADGDDPNTLNTFVPRRFRKKAM